MAEENIKNFTIATVFIFVCSVSLLYFAIGYPALNNQDSVLIQDPRFNNTAVALSSSLANYQDEANLNINISTGDDPQASADGLFLVSQTANSRNLISQFTTTWIILTTLLGNVFGLSSGEFTFVSGALLSLFTFVCLFYMIRWLRQG